MKAIKNIFLFILILNSSYSYAQESSISAFEVLADASWISEGKQLGGFEGKTVYEMKWDLNKQLVRVNSFSTDPKTKVFGFRSVGIRIYNRAKDQIEFYEFDKFNRISQGTVLVDGKNLHFEYEYEGGYLRDSWMYQNDDTYTFIVGTWENGDWKEKYHETTFQRDKK